MNQNEQQDFYREIIEIADYFKYTLGANDLQMYWKSLQKYSLGDVREAIQTHAEDPTAGRFMPKICDISRHILAKEVPKEHSAMTGWSQVERQIRSIGSYGVPVFDDPLISHVIHDMGGWIEMCKVLEKDLVWMGKDFERRYLSYADHQPAGVEPKQLLGHFSASNDKLQAQAAMIKLFGSADDKKATNDANLLVKHNAN